MPARRIHRDELLRLQAEGAQVVEVLPRSEYEWMHLAGAISLPLTQLDGATARAKLDPQRPVVTYCHDFQ